MPSAPGVRPHDRWGRLPDRLGGDWGLAETARRRSEASQPAHAAPAATEAARKASVQSSERPSAAAAAAGRGMGEARKARILEEAI